MLGRLDSLWKLQGFWERRPQSKVGGLDRLAQELMSWYLTLLNRRAVYHLGERLCIFLCFLGHRDTWGSRDLGEKYMYFRLCLGGRDSNPEK